MTDANGDSVTRRSVCSRCSEAITDPAEAWPDGTHGVLCQDCWEAVTDAEWWAALCEANPPLVEANDVDPTLPSVREMLHDAATSPKHGPRIRSLLDGLAAVVGDSRPLVGDQDGESSREIQACQNFTARRWSPLAERPEDGRCVNCDHMGADHAD